MVGGEFIGHGLGVDNFGWALFVVVVWVDVLEFRAKISEDVAHVNVEKKVGHG